MSEYTKNIRNFEYKGDGKEPYPSSGFELRDMWIKDTSYGKLYVYIWHDIDYSSFNVFASTERPPCEPENKVQIVSDISTLREARRKAVRYMEEKGSTEPLKTKASITEELGLI